MPTYSQTIPDWARQVHHLTDCRGCASGPYADGFAIAVSVYGDCGPNSGLTAFAYCWRRFGPPWIGSDRYKGLVTYVLGTPHPEIWLTLNLSGSRLPLAVGYLYTTALEQVWEAPRRDWELAFERWWLDHQTTAEEQLILQRHEEWTPEAAEQDRDARAIIERYWHDRMNAEFIATVAAPVLGRYPRCAEPQPVLVEALTAALVECLRPVWVRDVPVNILGRMADADLDEREIAQASAYAGCGVDKVAMDAHSRRGEA